MPNFAPPLSPAEAALLYAFNGKQLVMPDIPGFSTGQIKDALGSLTRQGYIYSYRPWLLSERGVRWLKDNPRKLHSKQSIDCDGIGE